LIKQQPNGSWLAVSSIEEQQKVIQNRKDDEIKVQQLER